MSVVSTAIRLKLSSRLSFLTISMAQMPNFDYTINGVASKFDPAAGDIYRPIDLETLNIMRYPKYRDAPPYVDDMHGDEKVLINRMKNVSLMQKYATDIQKLQADDEVAVLCPCNWCGKLSGHGVISKACGIGRYCDTKCQKKHWQTHKHYCEFFQQKQPLRIVYPWFEERASQATAGCPELFPPERNF